MALKLLQFFLSPPFSAHSTRGVRTRRRPCVPTTTTTTDSLRFRRTSRVFRGIAFAEKQELHLRNVKPTTTARETIAEMPPGYRWFGSVPCARCSLTLLTSLPSTTAAATAIHQKIITTAKFAPPESRSLSLRSCVRIDSIFCPRICVALTRPSSSFANPIHFLPSVPTRHGSNYCCFCYYSLRIFAAAALFDHRYSAHSPSSRAAILLCSVRTSVRSSLARDTLNRTFAFV